MLTDDDWQLYAEPREERARRQADKLDNAFGNLLRGNNTGGIAVILEIDGEEERYEGVQDEDEAVATAERFSEEYQLGIADIEYGDLARD